MHALFFLCRRVGQRAAVLPGKQAGLFRKTGSAFPEKMQGKPERAQGVLSDSAGADCRDRQGQGGAGLYI